MLTCSPQCSPAHTCHLICSPVHPQQNSTQQTMLTTWLIELYVNDLGNLRDEERLEEYKTLQAEFHQFLASPSLQVREGEGEKGMEREGGRGREREREGGRREDIGGGLFLLPFLFPRTAWRRIRRPYTISSPVMGQWKMSYTLPAS